MYTLTNPVINKFSKFFLLLVVAFLVSLSSIEVSHTSETPHYLPIENSTADHSRFKILKQEFESGSELTKACLTCHNLAAKQVHGSTHWNWEFTNKKTDQLLGKKHVLNNTLISIASNGPYCARCHIGNEWTEESFDFSSEEQVDCLACHDTTGTYASKKMHQLRARCSACHVEFDQSLAREVVQQPDYSELAQKVGKTSIATCGSCHFSSDGGDGVKHGDLDTSLLTANPDIDVHMAKESPGQGYVCTTCHATRNHLIKGSRYIPTTKDIRGKDVVGGSRATCESCHGLKPHPQSSNTKLNDHVDRIACQTCHIPALARGGRPTKTHWDWSTAGRFDEEDMDIIKKDAKGYIVYSSQRGGGQWAENLTPDYVWFNGKVKHLTLKDIIDPSKLVSLNILAGGPDDLESRIWPVKTLYGRQPMDKKNSTLVAARLFGKTDDAYWEGFEWKTAIEAGMKSAGLKFSGEFSFVDTEMQIPINHMVAPAKKALECASCHSRNGRMADVPGIFMPGRGSSAIVDRFGLLLMATAIVGVAGHGTMRIVMNKRKQRRS
ncbi:MAG: tetrathionate reductase family octaheme c-type cytochrome [Magnetococcales bacterium]|nr:tetrathionate reductase family octaheme c-type cytochrome [Magnetococcales bacterium]